MPRWFYGMCVVAILVALLIPHPVTKYSIFGLFGLVFLSFYKEHPERTLFVFIMGMPILDLIPPTIFRVPGLNAETLMVIALAVAVSFARRLQGQDAPNHTPFTVAVAYYAGVMTLSAALSYFKGTETAWELFSTVKNQLFYVFLLPIGYRLIWKEQHLRTMLLLIASTSALVSVHALWTVRSTVLAGFMLERNRASGLVAGQPNLFGGFLALMIITLICLLLSSKVSRRERFVFLVSLVACAGALLLTLSRGSWLALLVTLAGIALLRGARAVVFVAIVAASAPLWLPEKVIERVNHTFEGRMSSEDQELEDSAQVRVDQWKHLPEIFFEAPVFGHGLQAFRKIWAAYASDGQPKSAHSSIIELAVEEGVLGLLAYAWLLAAIAWTGFQAWRRGRDALISDVGLAVMGMVVCLAILDMSGTRFRNREVMAYFWLIGGATSRILVAQGAPEEGKATPAQSKRGSGRRHPRYRSSAYR